MKKTKKLFTCLQINKQPLFFTRKNRPETFRCSSMPTLPQYSLNEVSKENKRMEKHQLTMDTAVKFSNIVDLKEFLSKISSLRILEV